MKAMALTKILTVVLTGALALAGLYCSPAQAQQQMASRPGLINGLPPATMDSFVYEAGPHAEHIYGDEGTNGLPPYQGFSAAHRINAGIMDQRDAGLTTGHGSFMPKAFGADEFIQAPGEWGQSGYRNHTSGSGFADDGVPVMGGGSGGGGGGGGGGQDYDPPPGPGYQPATVHGVFVGWYSPEEVALAQTDFPAAFEHFVYSDRYQGSWENAMFILEVEMGRPQGGH